MAKADRPFSVTLHLSGVDLRVWPETGRATITKLDGSYSPFSMFEASIDQVIEALDTVRAELSQPIPEAPPQ